ncbi:MAG TPA: excinuclease ABC subunit UvrC [Candidatus Ornithospirochaeta stercorigallinarum]|nr:excinuclease ABC subunit UvrC [Candidatus Ornithospirochaeta stercorigallinarum]
MSARDQARALPENPGCYLMKDMDDNVIYVGKAKNLKRRVSSYFLPNRDLKTTCLVEKIDHIDYIITGNEYEALVLENNLIKKYTPHYNILLKDGKSYPVIRITNEDFPRIFKTRRIIKDGSKYYGPYAKLGELNTYLDLVAKSFPLRLCSGPLSKRKEACLYYHIGRCSAPCINKISKEEYGKYIRACEDFLSGDDASLIKQVEKEMYDASKRLDFETAAKKRDILEALKGMQSNQMVQDWNDEESKDYVAIEMRSYLTTISIMQFRNGSLIGKALYRSESLGDETETLFSFIVQYYSDGESLPHEIYVSHEIDASLIERFFDENYSHRVKVLLPRDGKHYRILRLAQENATRDIEKRLKETDNTPALEILRKELSLERLPRHIEGFDIAQLSGKYTVASLIVFRDGNPSRSEYRHFSIKSLEGKIDDFESMREAVSRRYSRLLAENAELPDLLMIDGGKGQVNAVVEILEALGIADRIPVIGLAKEHEELVPPRDGETIRLPHSNEGLRVLIAVRDECHRFATSFNQRMRSKEASFSLLESIEGMGKKRSERVMKAFGSVERILSLSPEELSKGASIPLDVARRILHKLNF